VYHFAAPAAFGWWGPGTGAGPLAPGRHLV